MEKIAITPPAFCYPKKDPEHPCECQNRPVELTHKTCLLFWQRQAGDRVAEGEIVAEAEADKKTMELAAPAAGVLTDICVADGAEFRFGDVLGYIAPNGG